MPHTPATTINSLVTPADFNDQYASLLAQRDPALGGSFTSFEELKAAVKLTIEADGAPEGRDEMLAFESFEDFFDWYDGITAYDQMDSEDYAKFYKTLLDVVYRALVGEYEALAQAEAYIEGTPESTMKVLGGLKAMHPELLWGTRELGDYDQLADIDAPDIVIYFSKHFHSNRDEMPDAYSDFCGSKVPPSENGVSEGAAKLLRQHNKINFIREPHGRKAAWVFKTVEGVEASHALAGMLLAESAAFTVTPLPDDFYEFSVKEDRKALLLDAE